MDMPVILCCNTLLIQPLSILSSHMKCTILTSQKKSSIQDCNFPKHSKSTQHTDVANNHSSTVMLNTQPTSYPPLNLENKQTKLKKKKTTVTYEINSQTEREILTPELQSTVNMYLH
jgi:hypothetical protein